MEECGAKLAHFLESAVSPSGPFLLTQQEVAEKVSKQLTGEATQETYMIANGGSPDPASWLA